MTRSEIASSYDVPTLINIARGQEGSEAAELRIAAASRLAQMRFLSTDEIIFDLIFDDDYETSKELRRWLLESWIRGKPWSDQLYWANRLAEELLVTDAKKLNQALSAFSVIGIPVHSAMEWIEMKSGDDEVLVADVYQCLSILAWMGNTSLDVLSTRWKNIVEGDGPSWKARETAWSVLHPNNLQFFLDTWNQDLSDPVVGPVLARLAHRFAETTERVMNVLTPILLDEYMWFSNYIDGIDSAKLVELTADQLAKGVQPGVAMASRVERFHLPLQVEGIGRITTFQKKSVLNALAESLLRPSNSPGDLRFDTIETQWKESAWKIACAMGISESKHLLHDAILSEEPHWLAERLVKLASITSMPDTVLVISQLLAKNPPNYGVTISLLRSLGTVASPEALSELLRFRLKHETGYPQDWCNSIVSCLYHSGGTDLVWRTYLDSEDDSDFRQALAYVILDASEAGLARELLADVTHFLTKEIEAVGAPELMLASVNWLGTERDEATLEILHLAPQVDSLSLAVALLLTGMGQHRMDVLSKYGFVHEGQWHFTGPVTTWSDYLVRIICNRDHTQQHLISEFLTRHFSTSPRSRPSQLVYGLHLDRWEPATIESFEHLAYRYNSPSMIDSSPFETLAKAGPDRFSRMEFWSGIQERLSFECIAAILEVLPETLNQKIVQLPDFARLATAEDSKVRHAVAKRIVQARGEDALIEIYLDAVKHDDIAGCVYIVEVAARLLSDNSWKELESHCSKHLHPEIRKTAKYGNDLRYDAQLAHRYWQQLLDVLDEDIFACFKFANAIVELADQDILALVTHRLHDGVQPRKSAHHSFMKEFRDRLEKTVKEKKDKWQKELKLPEPVGKPEQVTVNLSSEQSGSRLDDFPSDIAMEFWDSKSWHNYMRSIDLHDRFDGTYRVAIQLVDDEQNLFTASGTAFWLPEDESLERGRLAVEASNLRLVQEGRPQLPPIPPKSHPN